MRKHAIRGWLIPRGIDVNHGSDNTLSVQWCTLTKERAMEVSHILNTHIWSENGTRWIAGHDATRSKKKRRWQSRE